MVRRTVVFVLLFMVMSCVVSAVRGAGSEFCFQLYGSQQNGFDPGVYSIHFTEGTDALITKTGTDKPTWLNETVSMNGFAFHSNYVYRAIAAGTQYRSAVYGPSENISSEKWILIESVNGGYQYQEPWYAGVPLAAAWQNNQLVIVSPYGTNSIQVNIFTVEGKDSHNVPTEVKFDYSDEPSEIQAIHWDDCSA